MQSSETNSTSLRTVGHRHWGIVMGPFTRICTAFTIAAPLVLPGSAPAQTGDAQRELVVSVEPIAAGIRYLHPVTSRVRLGGELIGGPAYAARVGGPSDLREWGSAFLSVGLQPAERLSVLVSPIGLATSVGDDFGTVYPSGQAGLELAVGRARVGTAVRVVRIAGPNGTGDYRTTWVPLRVGISFLW